MAEPIVVLASGSPRRAELLRSLGITPEISVPDVDETALPGEEPMAHVLRLARAKASVRPGDGRSLVIAADTVVVIDGDIVGKPADEADAASTLGRLSGRAHEVITGVALRLGEAAWERAVTTTVRFRPIEPAEIERYVAGGEPMDKAGSYAIQGDGAAFVDSVDGSLTNVIGLPVEAVVEGARALGVELDPGR